MTYLQWNNIISEYFFNPTNAGKDIYLYLTKSDLINFSKQYFGDKTDEEIWADFIGSVKRGIPGATGNIITRAKYAYDKRNHLKVDSVEIKYPAYIAYLVFIVFPLIEGADETFSANNYYDRLNQFLHSNKINETIGTQDFRNCQINCLWQDLGNWANLKKNGELGVFNILPFNNGNWIYVGKIFSQCVFPPKAIRRLPELFLQAGMVPNSYYSPSTVKRYLQLYGSSILHLPNNALSIIRSDSNELALSIIAIFNREYKKWTGETHAGDEIDMTHRVKRNYTIVPLFLQFKVNNNDGLIFFSFRAFSSNDYPEDLKFGGYDNIYERNGWSRTLQFHFKESFELKDNFNKWIARFPERDIRLFISAGTHQLSNDYWIETETLSRTDPMYLLCRNGNRESVQEWGKSFHKGNFQIEDLEGLPENYSLFKILNPIKSHPDIPLLTLYTEKRIELVEGLKVNFRTYINDFLPEVVITNCEGNEKVFIQYRHTEEKYFLSRKHSHSNRWLLPEDTLLNVDFYIKVEDENYIGNEIAYNLISSNDTAIKVNEMAMPKRDSFGRPITTNLPPYCLGSNIISPKKSSLRLYSPYAHLFTSTIHESIIQVAKAALINHCGNMLCSFLSLKTTLTTEEFYRAFEFYYSKEFPEGQAIDSFNLTRTKRAALNFYDYVGILDYDYESKSIIVNSPQFILIPTQKGRKILLIGARDISLIEAIINTAPEYNLQVELTKQFYSNEKMLLPDAITIKAFGSIGENYGEKKILEFSEKLQIKYTSDYFPQIALHEFSGSIDEYCAVKQLTDENDYGWARKIFNPEILDFERSETATFDKLFSLVEYKLNEYTYYYKLWENGKCYQVDRNWGKYLVLKRFNKNVILFDNSRNRVAIPLETPLPRLLAESILLLSGLAPDLKVIDDRYHRVYENIPGIFTQNLFRKLGQQPLNRELI